MGIFDSIRDTIFGKANAAPVPPAATTSTSPAPQAPAPTPTEPKAAPGSPAVDVSAVLEKAVASKKQKLNWRTSIVDLMKALDLDSSLAARRKLAKELNYTGDTKDSARMNVWLHKALMKKLAENGGKVPADLLD
ncbi:MAG: DUF3597 domain-containing protein [Parvibaculaceae bacterium]